MKMKEHEEDDEEENASFTTADSEEAENDIQL